MSIPLRGLRRTLPLEAGNIPATGTGQGPKVSSRMAERRVSSGPTARGDAMTPTRRARGLFHEITEGVYWFLALDVLLRSEEHTSELQSRGQLVCRLLLEISMCDSCIPR